MQIPIFSFLNLYLKDSRLKISLSVQQRNLWQAARLHLVSLYLVFSTFEKDWSLIEIWDFVCVPIAFLCYLKCS